MTDRPRLPRVLAWLSDSNLRMLWLLCAAAGIDAGGVAYWLGAGRGGSIVVAVAVFGLLWIAAVIRLHWPARRPT